MAIENGPFVGDFPNKTSIHRVFSSQPCLMTPEGLSLNPLSCHAVSHGSGLNWRIQDVEIIFQMNDAEAGAHKDPTKSDSSIGLRCSGS